MITLVFGAPGSGKTAYLQRLAIKAKRPVYSNVQLGSVNFFDVASLGKVSFPEGSLILIDEAGIEFNNRERISKNLVKYFKLHRHYKVDIVFVSQDFEDVDITIRRLAERYIYIKKLIFCSLLRPVSKFVMVDETTHQITYGYRFQSFFNWRLFSLYNYVWRYNSYDVDNHPPSTATFLECNGKRTLKLYLNYFVYALVLLLIVCLFAILF